MLRPCATQISDPLQNEPSGGPRSFYPYPGSTPLGCKSQVWQPCIRSNILPEKARVPKYTIVHMLPNSLTPNGLDGVRDHSRNVGLVWVCFRIAFITEILCTSNQQVFLIKHRLSRVVKGP